MSQYIIVGIAMLAGAAFGAAAVQGLHAQAKPKAYLVTEIEVIDATAAAAYGPKIQATQTAAGAHQFNTAGGKITAFEGVAPPKRVAITQWDSLEQAQGWFNSSARKNLLPERDKAEKILSSYVVEAVN